MFKWIAVAYSSVGDELLSVVERAWLESADHVRLLSSDTATAAFIYQCRCVLDHRHNGQRAADETLLQQKVVSLPISNVF